MNKLYIPLLAIAVVGGDAAAQSNLSEFGRIRKTARVEAAQGVHPAANGINRDVIWSDDFSNPGNWVAGAITGYDSDTWVIGTEAPAGSARIDPIESTTAANGFALFDSDSYCGGNQNATLTLNSGIDLSLYVGAVLQVEQYTARWRGDYFVDVSIDGGATWTEFEVNSDLAVTSETNTGTMPNPSVLTVDISNLVAGQEDVRFRFRYFSTTTDHTDQGGCDYAWMVDDVAIVTLPEHEIIMNYAFASMTAEGDEYGRIPASQLPGTISVGAGIFNFGMSDQLNVNLHVTFEDAAGNDVPGFSTVIPVGTILSRDTAEVSTDITVPTGLPIGVYTGRFTLTGDQIDLDTDPGDNELSRVFAVTTDVYSLDGLGVHPTGTESTQTFGSFVFEGNSEVYLMTMYSITSQTTATGIQVELVGAPYTVPGAAAEIEAFIYSDIDQIQNGGVIEGGPVAYAFDQTTSGTHTITAADVTARLVYLAFTDPISLAPGSYYAAVRVKGSGTWPSTTDPDVAIWDDTTVPQPGWSSAVYIPNDFDASSGTEGRHSYSDGNAFAVRLIGSPTASIADAEALADISLFPNPTDGLFQVRSDRTELLFVEVTDILGQLVHTTNFMGTATIDLSKVAAGVYNVAVSSKTGRSVHRVSVK